MRQLQQLIAAVLLCASPLFAQDEIPTRVTNQNRMGPLPYSTSVGSDIEHVDLATGALSVHIPIWSVPGRGMDAGLSFHWNSNYLIAAGRTDSLGRLTYVYNIARDSGWQSNHPYFTIAATAGQCSEGVPVGQTPKNVFWATSHIYYDEEGGQHTLAMLGGGGLCAPPQPSSQPDLTAAGMQGNASPLGATTADGVHVGAPDQFGQNPLTASIGSYEDANGNTRASNTDTLGRPLYTAVDAPLDANQRPTQTTFTVTDPNGQSQNIVVVWQPLTITTNFATPGVIEANGLLWYAISSITFQNGTSYHFKYETDYGELTEIDLPSGGVIQYTYANYTYPNPAVTVPDQESRRYVASRTETVNGVSHTWTFQLSADAHAGYDDSTVKFPPVQTPSGGTVQNQSVFVSSLGSVLDARIYNGSATGTPLREYFMNYLSDDDPTVDSQCDTSEAGPPFPQPMGTRMTRLITVLENGQASKKEFDYDKLQYTFYPYHCSTKAQSSQPVPFTASRGNVTAIRDYGFGTVSGVLSNMDVANAPLLRTTTRTYLQDSNAAYASANIVDKIASEVVTDNVNNLTASQLQILYDQTPISSTPNLANVPAHDGTFTNTFTTRGNPTQVKRWNNSDGTFLTTTYNYDDLGNIRRIVDPKGNTTSWIYDDSFDSGTLSTCAPASNSFAYVSKKTDAAGHKFFVTRRACTGQVNSHRDDNDVNNSRPGTLYAFDLMGRPVSVRVLDASSQVLSQTSNTYNDTVLPVSSTKTVSAAPDPDIIQDTIFDGLHRVSQTVMHDPEGNDLVDSSYDPYGRVATVSNPHRTIASATDGTTTTFYDAISRPLQVTKQDGGTVSYAYSGTQTTVTDETGRQRRSITDALGRLAEVDEPGDNYPGVKASGSVAASGSLRNVGTPTQATGSVSISGTEKTYTDTSDCSIVNGRKVCSTLPDSGTVWISVNGLQKSYPFGDGDTATSVASNLASDFNSDPSSPVTASLSGTTITFTSKASGSSTNYTLSCGQTSHANSFIPSASGANLTGGTDGGNVIYDSGTATLTLDSGFTASAPYSQSTNSTAAAVAAALAGTGSTGLNRAGSPVSATANGATLTITYNTAGTAGDMAVTLSSATGDPAHFSGGSFCSPQCTSTLAGGDNPEGPSLDHAFYVTKYVYDALGNLFCVEQHGNAATGTGCPVTPPGPTDPPVPPDPNNPWRRRVFAYDSLSRLRWASNPEANTISYAYDADGVIVSKTDARGITINYSPSDAPIDALNRVRKKIYSNGDAAVTFTYDQGPNAIGRLSSEALGTISNSFSYDAMGRVISQTDCLPSGCRTVTVPAGGYDLASALTSLGYPDTRSVNTTYNAAGRMVGVKLAQFNGVPVNVNYYTVPQATSPDTWGYFPTGAMNRGTYGNGVIETTGYNGRLQVSSICESRNLSTCDPQQGAFSSKSYGVYDSSGHNNGNVLAITDGLDITKNQAYTYDPLNRILAASQSDNAFNVNYNIDPWGNMKESGTSNFQQSFDPNNRMSGWSYDASGNLLNDGAHSYAYDAEGRIKTVDGTGAIYTYGPEGERVRKDTASETVEYVYFGNDVIAELNPSTVVWTDYIFGYGGKRLAKDTSANGSGVQYYQSDHLNSTRIMTDASSIPVMNCTYGPYGEQAGCSQDNASNRYRYTGKEKDRESGLDNFGARYYTSSMGRFMSADPSGLLAQKPEDPQSWNLYAYARNNPLIFLDPDGLDCVYANDAGDGVESIDHDSNSGECGQNGGSWVPGYADENWAHFNRNTGMFQVGSINGEGTDATVDYTMFEAGAQTQFNGNESSCLSGCAGFSEANANWLQSQLVGNSIPGGLDGYIQFLTGREQPLGGGLVNQLVSGPLDLSTDHWAGPGGMGPPGGQGDWAASVHDYNFSTNGAAPGQGITIGNYFNPTLPPATSKALIQSNKTLIRHAGGFQSVKMGLFFGAVNAFQWYANSFK